MEPDSQDLPPGGVRTLLRDLGGAGEYISPLEETWTGVLRVVRDDENSTEASLWMRGGQVYSASMEGFTPPMATRLVSAGCLSEEEAAELDATVEISDIGSIAISKYGIDRGIVEEIHREVTLAVVSHLYEWENARWNTIPGKTFPGYMTSPMPLMLVVSAVDERIGQWRAVSRAHPRAIRPNAVPQPGPAWLEKTGQEVTAEMASLLAHVDGRSSVARIANSCGFTRFETARLLQQAIAEGLLVFPPPVAPATAPDEDNSSATDIRDDDAAPDSPDQDSPGSLHDALNDNDDTPPEVIDSNEDTQSLLAALDEAERLARAALDEAQTATQKATQAQQMVAEITAQLRGYDTARVENNSTD